MPGRGRQHGLFAALAAVALLLTACPADDAPPADPVAPAPDARIVDVADNAFAQAEITISVGEAVGWANRDDHEHTIAHGQDGVASDDRLFNLPLPPGETRDFTFEEAGTYPITCSIHPQMNMTVIVEE